jgi:hypothetical protein
MVDTNNMFIYLQQNVGRSYNHTITALQNAMEIGAHALLIQKPCYGGGETPIKILAYTPISPNYTGAKPRVITYWRNDSPFKYCQLNHICDDSDVIILNVTGPGLIEFKLINVYNEKRQGEEIGVGQYTVERSLERKNI